MTVDWLSGACYLLGVVAGVCAREIILWELHVGEEVMPNDAE